MQILNDCLMGVVIFIAGCLVGYVAGRWTRKGGKASKAGFYDKVLKEILECLKIPGGEAEAIFPTVMDELKAGRRFSDPRMAPVFRIECVYDKIGNGKYELTTVVYQPGTAEGHMKMTRIMRRLDWSELPSDALAEFVRNQPERATILMYERKEDGNA